jgi:V/A-type H+-transporting ATPase subunit D
MELLAHRAQIELAQQGRDLLQQKQTALMKELLKIADTVLQKSDALQSAATEAHKALARAEVMAGVNAVHSAALASSAELPLEVTTTTVMGVRVPHIEQKRISRSCLGRGYSIVGTSTAIDEAASAFEIEVDSIIQLAESELCLTRLAKEIQSTLRRLNALDQFLIPRLEAELDYIQSTLDEHERSDHFRLKRVKHTLERKRMTAAK